ncbi:MAG: DUF721 domain-containing protein [Candidatus Omnitrophica bacterium]|nr:DUF721 domain-containing protein [Candidatus Omnitrophota bacterium]HOX54914.1 DUF721 domain-containing protein [Candidatus Omnitrophota bacterium]
MEQIKTIVHDVIKKLSIQGAEQAQDIQRAWSEAVGKKVSCRTQIEGLRNGRMLVLVDSPVTMFHLNLKRNQLLKELQKIDKAITTIDLRVGKVQ